MRKITKTKKILDLAEDCELGRIAKERESTSSAKDYISIKEALRKVIAPHKKRRKSL